MSKNKKHNLLRSILFLSLSFITLSTQSQKVFTTVSGLVLDSISKSPLENATVIVRDVFSNEIISGISSNQEGSFKIYTDTQDFILEIKLIGYEDKIFNELDKKSININLGAIYLKEQINILNEVEVRADKSTTEFRLDKRVFNVGKDLSSTGASAYEVLENVPSVTVTIEGEVSLRGNSGVQILINGKPSVLADQSGNALGTITADMIERVEVITNPSAKYEAEGTAGIINIVIKKEQREGMNGSFTLNSGSPLNNSAGLSINRRTEKINVFSQFGYGYRKLPSMFKNSNYNLTTKDLLKTKGTNYRNEEYYNLILGTDYYINNQNVITLSGYYAFEDENQPSNTNVKIFQNVTELISEWDRNETTVAGNPKYQYELIYKRDFLDNEDHTLIFSATGNLFTKEQSSNFENKTVIGSSTFNDQKTKTDFGRISHTVKLDYVKPFYDKWEIEMGAQFTDNDLSNDFEVQDLQQGIWLSNQGLTNVFDFRQKVFGLYGTGSFESDKWGVKLGLRREHTNTETNLVNSNLLNSRNFADLFPTFHSSFKLIKKLSLQLGYSRRIYRPSLWQLNPFINIRNNFNISAGNPDLRPEYSDSYELAAIYNTSGLSINCSIYQLNTTEKITYVTTLQNNISERSPENLGTSNANGIEINGKFDGIKKIVITSDFNLNRFNRRGIWGTQNFNFNGTRWSSELRSKIKFPKDLDVEATLNYLSGYSTVDGERGPSRNINFGVRKKIADGRGVINLMVRDIFGTRVSESRAIRSNFIVNNWATSGTFFSLGFSYGFGKGEAMEYQSKGGRRR